MRTGLIFTVLCADWDKRGTGDHTGLWWKVGFQSGVISGLLWKKQAGLGETGSSELTMPVLPSLSGCQWA